MSGEKLNRDIFLATNNLDYDVPDDIFEDDYKHSTDSVAGLQVSPSVTGSGIEVRPVLKQVIPVIL